MSIIFITGGTGYLGSNLIKSLNYERNDIWVIKRSISATNRLDGYESKINYFNIEEGLSKLFESKKEVETIIHLATNRGRNNEKEEEVYRVNFDFPKELFDLSLSFNVSTFINADTGLPPDFNAYTSSKKKFKNYAKKEIKESNMKFFNLEIENFFGPNDSEGQFTAQLISSCLKDLDKIDLSSGNQIRDFFHIQDLIECINHIMKCSTKLDKGFYNLPVGSGEAIPLKFFCSLVKKKTGSKIKLNFGAIPYRENEVMNSVADLSDIKKLGWTPRISLSKAIDMTLKDWKF